MIGPWWLLQGVGGHSAAVCRSCGREMLEKPNGASSKGYFMKASEDEKHMRRR